MNLCYACGAPATTVEHLPPKVFFPERKDFLPEDDDPPDLRVNLISVPACEAHNNAYSSDDEYVAFAIAAYIGANSFGLTQWQMKVSRVWSRSPKLREAYGSNGEGYGAHTWDGNVAT